MYFCFDEFSWWHNVSILDNFEILNNWFNTAGGQLRLVLQWIGMTCDTLVLKWLSLMSHVTSCWQDKCIHYLSFHQTRKTKKLRNEKPGTRSVAVEFCKSQRCGASLSRGSTHSTLRRQISFKFLVWFNLICFQHGQISVNLLDLIKILFLFYSTLRISFYSFNSSCFII